MLIVLWECGNCAALFFFVLLKQLEKKERRAMGYQYTTGKVAASVTFLEPDLREELKKKAEDMGYAIQFIDRHLMDRDEISVREKEEQLEWLRDSEIILTSRGRFVDQTSQNLRWAADTYAGIDVYFPREDGSSIMPHSGVMLTNSSGAYGPTISEHIIMVLLMLWRRQWDYNRCQQEHSWGPRLEMKSIMGSDFVVLGTGNIGTTFAKKAKALGAGRIMGVSRSGKERCPGVYDEMHTFRELKDVIGQGDAVVMSLPGTEETAGMVDSTILSAMKDSAVLVNVGRGSSVVQEDLVEALEKGRIWGAALDVMENEPLPEDDPLWTMKNCIVTPHVAGNMTLRYTRELIIGQFCRNLDHYRKGEKLDHLIDLGLGY